MTYIAESALAPGVQDLFHIDADGTKHLYGHVWPASIVQAVLDALNAQEEGATLMPDHTRRGTLSLPRRARMLASFAALFARLGQPHIDSSTRVQWNFDTPVGPVKIFGFKDYGSLPAGEYDWYLCGEDFEAVQAFAAAYGWEARRG